MASKIQRKTALQGHQRKSTCLGKAIARTAMTVHPHEAMRGTAPAIKRTGETPGPGWIRASYRLLMMRGLSAAEAGNLVAYMVGLHATGSAWSLKQIEQLVALRSLAECGLVGA